MPSFNLPGDAVGPILGALRAGDIESGSLAVMKLSEWVQVFTLLVLVATLGAILWYSWETRGMRREMEKTRLAEKEQRTRLVGVGPTCADLGSAGWLFFYEFRPVAGTATLRDSAVMNAGGAIHLRDQSGKSRHQAETIWAGSPPAGTAHLYAKKGLLILEAFPKGHMVIAFSAGTAPHADLHQLGRDSLGDALFDWNDSRDWTVEITAAAPEADSASVQTTVSQLLFDARGDPPFPGFPPILTRTSELKEGIVVRGRDKAIYLVEGDEKRLFPSLDVFRQHNFDSSDVVRADDQLLQSLKDGPVMPIIL